MRKECDLAALLAAIVGMQFHFLIWLVENSMWTFRLDMNFLEKVNGNNY